MIVAAASIAIAVVLLDLTSVAVLLPTIRLDLGSSSSGAGWVMGAYLVAFAALLLALPRLARKRELAVGGIALMAAGAVVSATAGSTAELVAGRAIAGGGAAAVLASLAAAGALGGALLALPALALALGPFVGGAFAENNWWHLYFWCGVPLAVVAGLPALVAARPDSAQPAGDHLRQLGLAAGLVALTIALIQAESWDWWAWGLLLVAAVVLARPPLPTPLAATAALVGACLAALSFLMPEYFELVRRLSGLRSGALVLALTVSAVAVWGACRVLGQRLPARPLAQGGLASAAVGLGALGALEHDTGYALIVAALVLVGTGLGAAAGAIRGSDPAANVLAWGFAGATLGLATTLEAFQQAQSDERSGGASFEQALSRGVGWGALVLVVWVVVVGVWIWRATPASSAARPAGASSPPPRHPA